jgi:hypothetical protein
MNPYPGRRRAGAGRTILLGEGFAVHRGLTIKDLITPRKENFAAGSMFIARHARFLAASILIVSSLTVLAGLLMHDRAAVANICSFAEIEENGCGADAG